MFGWFTCVRSTRRREIIYKSSKLTDDSQFWDIDDGAINDPFPREQGMFIVGQGVIFKYPAVRFPEPPTRFVGPAPKDGGNVLRVDVF